MLLDGFVSHPVKKPLDWRKLSDLHGQLFKQAQASIADIVASKSSCIPFQIDDAWKDQYMWGQGLINPPFFYLELGWTINRQPVLTMEEEQLVVLGDIAAKLAEITGLSVRRVPEKITGTCRYRYMMTHPPHQLSASSRKRGCRSKWFQKTQQVA
jgi:hypothetical protein